MSRNYTRLGRYEQLFNQLDAAISRLESRCDKIERRVTNLPASKATYAQQACYDSRREIRTRPLPKPPPQPAQDLPYYLLPSCDPPGHRHQFGRAAYEPLPARRMSHHPGRRNPMRFPPYEQPEPYRPRPQPSPVRLSTCWDPPEQHGYPPQEPPTPVEPLDRECARFQPLPQPPQPHRYLREVDKDRCYGEVVTHTHSPALNDDEELCDSENSIFETTVTNLTDHGLPSDNQGSREGRDGRLEDQQVSSFVEIYPLRSPDMHKEKEEEALLEDVEEDNSTNEVKKVVASLNVVQVPPKSVVEICWGKKVDGAYTGLPVIACVYVPSMNLRLTSLDADARLIPPRNNTPCLSIHECVTELSILVLNLDDHISLPLLIFYGGKERRRSAVRCVFDPGGDASPKLMLSTFFVASWLPP